jgi:hypothetical protein
MSDIEKELKKVLKTNGRFDSDKNAARRKEIGQMIFNKFQNDMLKVKVVFYIFFVLSLGMMVGGISVCVLQMTPGRCSAGCSFL